MKRTHSLGAHSLSADSCKSSILSENFTWAFLLFSQDKLILLHVACSNSCNWPFSSKTNSTTYKQQEEFRYCTITSFKFQVIPGSQPKKKMLSSIQVFPLELRF